MGYKDELALFLAIHIEENYFPETMGRTELVIIIKNFLDNREKLTYNNSTLK